MEIIGGSDAEDGEDGGGGGEEGKTCQSYLVRTKKEMSDLLDNPSFLKADKIQLVEVVMEMLDAPKMLLDQTSLSTKTNSYIEVV